MTRRELLTLAGQAGLVATLAPRHAFAANENSSQLFGAIVGDPTGAKIGEKVLQDGGNAIDAAVTAAFAAGIASPSKCGVGGYGGHAIISLAGGRKITAIDFDSMAPAAARPDMFKLDANGKVIGGANVTGWLAAGVPGTVAGLELALTRYGSRSLRDALTPAIRLCEEGVHVAPIKGLDDASHNDARPEAAQAGKLPPEKQRNLALAKLLKTLAGRNTAESFYRGDIADTIAAAFQRHGGLVTREDLAAYRAREVAPLKVNWNGATLHTVPLPATGLLLLEACAILEVLGWTKLPLPQQQQAKLEALRIAWADRLRTFGDPEVVKVPVEELISPRHAATQAEKISEALQARKPVPLEVDPSRAGGTINLSALDRHGNFMAITLTHGGSFGARVSAEELGMVLGHGMSRFDPRPGLPNSVGPRKRPITNMCPTLVTRTGEPVVALGGAGGTRIPSSMYEVLINIVGRNAWPETALVSPRLDTVGTLMVGLEKSHTAEDEAFFKKLGYQTRRYTSAYISAVWRDEAGRPRGMAAGSQ